MYEAVQQGIPFVLAGSIRDDGPLRDIDHRRRRAQKAYVEALEGAGVCLMLASALHSIAVGNLLPARVRTVCVDMTESVPVKLVEPRHHAGDRPRDRRRVLPRAAGGGVLRVPRAVGRRTWGPGGLPFVLLAAVGLHLPTLRGYFLGDDFAFVRLYQSLPARLFGALFFEDWSQGIWRQPGRELRPLLALSYWLDFRLWGANALGYRLTNLLWLVLALWGLHRLAASRERAAPVRAGWIASIATLVFAAHPTLPGAVDWVAGRSDLLAAAATFWSLHFLARHLETGRAAPAVAGALAFAGGLFAKESTVVVALLLPGLLALEAADGAGRDGARPMGGSALPVEPVSARVGGGYGSQVFGPSAGPWVRSAAGKRAGATTRSRCCGCHSQPRRPSRSPRWPRSPSSRGGRAGARAPWLFWGVLWPLAALAPAVAATYESPRHVLLALAGPAVVLARLLALAWIAAARAARRRRRGGPDRGGARPPVGPDRRASRADGRASHELRRLLAAAPAARDAQTAIVSTPRSDDAVFWTSRCRSPPSRRSWIARWTSCPAPTCTAALTGSRRAAPASPGSQRPRVRRFTGLPGTIGRGGSCPPPSGARSRRARRRRRASTRPWTRSPGSAPRLAGRAAERSRRKGQKLSSAQKMVEIEAILGLQCSGHFEPLEVRMSRFRWPCLDHSPPASSRGGLSGDPGPVAPPKPSPSPPKGSPSSRW